MKISVIMASYNYEQFIGEAIESVIAQNYREWELIVVDDGSSDDSRSVISRYQSDPRIRLYSHDNNLNKGLVETLKLGLSKCTGNYAAFLESDDIWNENCLSARVKVLEQYPEVDIVANGVELFGDTARIATYSNYFVLQERCFSKRHFPCDIFPLLLRENFIPTFSCAMVRTELLRQCSFNIAYPPWLDRYLWLQLAYHRNFYYLDKQLTKWRIHSASYIKKEADAYKTDNNLRIKSMIREVFVNREKKLSNLVKFHLYYYVALWYKYVRAISRRIKKI